MYRFQISDTASDFFRRYQVKLPNAGVKSHNVSFIDRQLENIDHLCSLIADEELVEALANARKAWESVDPRNIDNVLSSAPSSMEFSFRAHCELYGACSPRGMVVHPDAIDDELTKLDSAIANLPSGARKFKRDLVRWKRDWMATKRRYELDFGGADSKTGPSASYLARKAEKRERSAKLRAAMKGK